MKKVLIFLFLTCSLGMFSQIEDPIKWSTSVEKISDTEFVLISKATIEKGWHLYSQNVPEDGPIPTTFSFDTSKGYFSLNGKTIEEEGVTVDDPVFQMKIKFFEVAVVFKQKIKTTSNIKTINGVVEFMVCDDSKCLAPTEIDLTFHLPKKTDKKSTNFNFQEEILNPIKWKTSIEKITKDEYDLIINAEIEKDWHLYSQYTLEGGSLPIIISKSKESNNYELVGKAKESTTFKKFNKTFNVEETFFDKKATLKQRVKLKNNTTSAITLNLTGQVCKEACIQIDENFTFTLSTKNQNTTTTFSVNNEAVNNLLYAMNTQGLKVSNVKCKNEVVQSSSEIKNEGKSLWKIFGLGFLGGLLALLTPCVFPMIPLTVSFFTKQSKSKLEGIKNALFYGLSIVIIYVLLGLIIVGIFGPSALNELSTSVSFNVIFFFILLFFSFSFFGYYELTLPSSWANKVDSNSNRKGFVGIFFMALALAIVSFSCTGPLVGSLLVESASVGGIAPIAGMLGFSLALAIPFALFAAFPGWLNSLPKSGGWLNTTKVVLGFLELALAFKFLSNADLVAHWNLLKIEPFLVLWILIFGALALYLFGKIKFPHDSPIKKLSFTRIASGILVVSFVIYLASGFMVNKETKTFTPLTLLSGLAPPVGYSFMYPNECPNNLDCFKDLKTGIEYAKKVNKPILLDFTGYACVNCRKMEEHVWPIKKIDDYLRNDYVLISLYVDDKKTLPKEEQLIVNRVNGGTKKLETYGHKWAHFQTQFFKTNSQPYYVLLNSNGTRVLNQPVGYTPNEDEYAKFLECGIEVFKNSNKN